MTEFTFLGELSLENCFYMKDYNIWHHILKYNFWEYFESDFIFSLDFVLIKFVYLFIFFYFLQI